jgi:hypothetical protein
MAEGEPRRFALGCITRYIESLDPFQELVRNARENGHRVDSLVIAFTGSADLAVLAELNDMVPLEVVEVGEPADLPQDLVDAGAQPDDVEAIVDTAPLEDHGLVPYCAQRNAVLLRALLAGIDTLCFFEPAMRAKELVGDPGSQSGRSFRPVDFVGPHLAALEAGAVISTGGYSGYDPFPPLQIDSLRDLLHGIGREESYEVIAAEGALAGIHLAPSTPPPPRPAHQVVAGNMAIDLRQAARIPPFFSGWYRLGDDVVLARGEDTLLGAAVARAQLGCTDVGTRVFLDPHDTYPEPPDISREETRHRLYWNCLGWIARLPVLDSVRQASGLLDWDLEELRASRRLGLQQGSTDVADAFRDNRFLDLPTFFDLAYMRIERTLARYETAQLAWRRTVEAIRPSRA